MQCIRFPKTKVKTYLKREDRDLTVIHQFDPFPYIISKRNASAGKCTYCELYSTLELGRSNMANYIAKKPSKLSLDSYYSNETVLLYLSNLREELKHYPHILELINQLFEVKTYSNFREYCEELEIDPYLDVIQEEYLIAIESFYQYNLELINLQKTLYFALDAIFSLLENRKCVSELLYNLKQFVKYNWLYIHKYNYLRTVERCEGSSEFQVNPCPRGFIFGTTDTVYESKTLFFITYYRIYEERSKFLPSKSFIYEFDTAANLVKAPPINNVYSSGEICFGEVRVTDCADRFNAFWSSHFNSDLDNDKNTYTPKEFFDRHLLGADDISQYSSMKLNKEALIYEE